MARVFIYDNDKPFVRVVVSNNNYFRLHKHSLVNIDDLEFEPLSYDFNYQYLYNNYLAQHPEYTESDIDYNLSRVKLRNNLSRTRRTVFDLAICNHWDYFGTITLNSINFPRDNLPLAYKSLCKYFNNYKSRVSPNFKYLCVPEMHKDKRNWHFHLLCSGININSLTHFSSLPKIPKKIKKQLHDGIDVYTFDAIDKRFGYNTFIPTYGTQESIAKYMTKYITKSFDCFSAMLNTRIVRASVNLDRPKTETLNSLFIPPSIPHDYINEFVTVYTMSLESYNSIKNDEILFSSSSIDSEL